ncbi:GRB2-associated-binding protein 1-like isoform X2 [Mya arenaria]|uniref:GRB2-associated-binding protein 1-like isoform X2 n=1 Tax=Mya arenaria TaxID=6604 RepID=UPI0022E9260B|nr:GRB2-associated-binding protein 1-like isoform X2 [Mya arenaria]
MNHVVYSGWMIKSPPEKKLTGPWKIFRAKWKKRYFVLSKPAQSLPGTYLLNYYSDENCKRVRGSIDLEQCAEIIEHLDSDQFQYLLAIKTTHKSKERTYFLATETEEQMSTWVQNLCSVCGMKPDETEAESPKSPHRENLPSRSVQSVQPQSGIPASAVGIMTKPQTLSSTVPAVRSSPSTRTVTTSVSKNVKPKSSVKPANQLEEYIPLESCTSGNKPKQTFRQESLNSVPDEIAPPPPGYSSNLDNDVFRATYDIPPRPSSLESEDLYKVPPTRPLTSSLEPYDIPPPSKSSPSTPRSSSSESQKMDSHSHTSQTYDVPPMRGDDELTTDDLYDVPPSHNQNISLHTVPPSRPPKPGHLQPPACNQEAYMNIPTNSKVFTEKSKGKSVDINSVVAPPPHSGMVLPTSEMANVDLSEMYDFPKSLDNPSVSNLSNGDSTDKLLMSTPPPPSVCNAGIVEHRYINAHKGVVEQPSDMYLPMDTVPTGPVSKARKSSSTDNEVEYTDMSGKSSFDDSFEGRQSIYDHPPPSRPAIPPPRPDKPTGALGEKHDTYSIFSTARTRSFKKKNEESPRVKRKSPSNARPNLVNTNVPLPQRVDRHPDFSTSDEDDEDMGSPDVWENIPPAPANKDTELKYVDLDHDDASDKEPVRSPHATTAPPAHTEYHEIDFVRTDAIRTLKETVTEERKLEKINT